MNSKTLIETGFSECIPLKNLSLAVLPQDKSSVIVIVDQELSGLPMSDILYIGRAKKIAKKIMGGYLAGYGGKVNKKINQMLFDGGYIEKVSISWTLTDKPRPLQKEMLTKFKEEHGNLPSWNSKKKQSAKTKITITKPKKTSSPKPKKAQQKVTSSSTIKLGPKPRVVRKKSSAKEEMLPKSESESKMATAGEASEKAKNESASTNQTMT
jgi:hypothetical protein